jgi:hypothetical protein
MTTGGNIIYPSIGHLKQAITEYAYEVPVREHSGRGIITASGGKKLLSQSLVSISILRQKGCVLPIELFYADEEEMIDNVRVILESILKVRCINVQDDPLFKNYNARNYSIKSISVYLSSFTEIIWMDCDVIPCVEMSTLFDTGYYKQHGMLFFNDIFSYGRKENAYTKKTRDLFEMFDVHLLDGEPETDSGLFVLDKARCGGHEFMAINLLLNTNNTLTYTYVYGDKELYNLSMRLCDKGLYTTVDAYPCVIGQYFAKEELFCGNGVIFRLPEIGDVCIHMTLHSVDHTDDVRYREILGNRLWTHYTTRCIDVDLRKVVPLNQAIVPIYRYDYKFVTTINEAFMSLHAEMLSLYRGFSNVS